MYSTPAVVTTSSSWVVNTALGLLCDPTLFQFRALVARIDEPEALQDLRLAVGLHLSQADRQRSSVLLVHLHLPAWPLEDDGGQDLDELFRVGGPRLLHGHGVGVDAVVFGLRERVGGLETGSELLLHRVEELLVLRVVEAREVISRVVDALRRIAARLGGQLVDGETADRHLEPRRPELLHEVDVRAASRRRVGDAVRVRRADLADDRRPVRLLERLVLLTEDRATPPPDPALGGLDCPAPHAGTAAYGEPLLVL